MACRRKVPTGHLASVKSLYPLGQPQKAPGRHTKNVKALQKLAGHSRIETTMKYIHPDAEDVMIIAHAVEVARAACATEEVEEVPTVQ